LTTQIRRPTGQDLVALQDIERAAGALFLDVGLTDVAMDEPFSISELDGYVRAGHAWLIASNGVIAGYALVDVIDANAHLEQLSVDPAAGRRGLGTELLEHVCRWAGDAGFRAVTLTTFEHVEWNKPFYATRGFTVMREDEIGPELRALRAAEAEDGLDPTLRVCMIRSVGHT
jgi:ribosomal protein S18 acetylase RimI-like enzyme